MKLDPCPFCGNAEPEITRYGTPRVSTQYECGWCGCHMETSEEWDHGRDWNRRAPAPMKFPPELVEAAKALLEASKVASETEWDWSGRKVDSQDGYVYIPQGSHLGNTLICLGDTYENSAKDCDFISQATKIGVLLAKFITDNTKETE